MPFEWFLMLCAIVMICACIVTPLIFKWQDKQHNKRIPKIGERK